MRLCLAAIICTPPTGVLAAALRGCGAIALEADLARVAISAPAAFNCPQSSLASSKVVRYLMPHHSFNLLLNLTPGVAPSFDWSAEDGYLVGQHHPIASASLGMRHSLVEAQKPEAAPDAGTGEL